MSANSSADRGVAKHVFNAVRNTIFLTISKILKTTLRFVGQSAVEKDSVARGSCERHKSSWNFPWQLVPRVVSHLRILGYRDQVADRNKLPGNGDVAHGQSS